MPTIGPSEGDPNLVFLTIMIFNYPYIQLEYKGKRIPKWHRTEVRWEVIPKHNLMQNNNTLVWEWVDSRNRQQVKVDSYTFWDSMTRGHQIPHDPFQFGVEILVPRPNDLIIRPGTLKYTVITEDD